MLLFVRIPQTYSRNYETGFKCSCALAYRSSLHGTYCTAGNAVTLWHKVISVCVTDRKLRILTERYTVGDITGLIDDVNTLKWLCSVLYRFVCFVFLWRCDPTRTMTSSFLRFLDHTQRRITVGRIPLDEWSARRRDFYLTTHSTHNGQTSMPRWDSNPRSQQASGRRPTP